MASYTQAPLVGVGALAVPAGVGTVVILPTLGATQFYRLVGGYLSVSRLTGLCDVTLEDTGAVLVPVRQAGLSPAGISYLPLVIPFPGICMPNGAGVQAVLNGSAVGGTFNGVLYYFQETFT